MPLDVESPGPLEDDLSTRSAQAEQEYPVKTPFWSRNVPKSLTRKVLAATVLLSTIPVITALQADSGYGVMQPGPVVKLTDAVSGDRLVPSKDTKGWFAFTTVEVSQLSYLEFIKDRFSSRSAVKLSPASFSQEAKAQMIESRETAAVLALRLARQQELSPSGVLVISVLADSPAAAAGLKSGDVIEMYAGFQIDSPTTLRTEVASSPAEASLVVRREKAELQLTVSPINDRIGVVVSPSYAKALAGLLAIDTGKVGGPSAGLLMTLATIDALSPGDLTAGLRIAGTGTIDQDGRVGQISGVSLKAAAAARTGAQWFLVPASLASEIPSYPKMQIKPVRNLTEALTQLCSAGATDVVCQNLPEVSA